MGSLVFNHFLCLYELCTKIRIISCEKEKIKWEKCIIPYPIGVQFFPLFPCINYEPPDHFFTITKYKNGKLMGIFLISKQDMPKN